MEDKLTEKITSLGLRTGVSQALQLWVVAVDSPEPCSVKSKTVSCILKTSNGQTVNDTLRLDGAEDSDGAVLEFLTRLAPHLAPGSALFILTLEASVGDATKEGWFAKWKAEGFARRKRWKLLDEAYGLAGVEYHPERPPKGSPDHVLLNDLADELRRMKEPKQRKPRPGARTISDWLMERALAKDH